ncbi:MAG: sugar phosphate isomerase/epimerase [Kiritimatiellae bacterium]|nr:sugar phosphate isomerase/epimerase [Kiritimatiellia bacterium]
MVQTEHGNPYTRRSFLGAGSLALAAACRAAFPDGCAAAAAEVPKLSGRVRFRLGMAGYTYIRLDIDKTLASMERAGVHHLCVKDRHLPLDAKPAEIEAFRRKCADHGVTPHGVGVIYMGSEEEAKRAFDYAAALGVPVVVGAPWKPAEDGSTDMKRRRQSPELCAKISDLCARYNLKFAIHNHSRNPKTGWPELFATPADAWGIVKDMDPRMGLCLDIAFAFADGLDPVDEIKKYSSRLFDLHFRNISDPKNGLSCTDFTTGAIDYVRVVRALAETGYDGVCGIELVHPFPKRPEWINTSVGYFRGLIEAVNHSSLL